MLKNRLSKKPAVGILRLKLVKDYFAIKNDSSTIQVLDYNTDNALNIGSRPRFAIKFSLAECQNDNDSIR